MSPAGRPFRLRAVLRAAALALVAALLSGCVYLRLLQLKRQFAEFDQYFQLQTAAGLRLDFLHPVLLADDLRFLGFHPQSVRRLGQAELWHIRWVKEPPPGGREAATYEIAFELSFAEQQLTALQISESYFAFMPKSVVVAALKSLGRARIDRASRQISTDVATALRGQVTPPTLPAITGMLGAPTGRETADGRETLRYHFISDDPGAKGRDFDLRLIFDAKSGVMLESKGRLPVGSLALKFDPPPAAPADASASPAHPSPATPLRSTP